MKKRKPIDIGALEPFDESNPADIACDMERRAASDFHVRRLHRADKHRDSDEAAIITGNAVALAVLFLSAGGDRIPEDALDRLHAVIDFAWVQALGMSPGQPTSGRVQ